MRGSSSSVDKMNVPRRNESHNNSNNNSPSHSRPTSLTDEPKGDREASQNRRPMNGIQKGLRNMMPGRSNGIKC